MLSLKALRPSLLGATEILQIAIYHLGKIFFARTRVEVRGIQNIENFQGNVVFAANHASELDPIVVCLALEKAGLFRERLPLIFLSREKAFYGDMGVLKAMLFGGFLFRLLGSYPVTPKSERTTADTRRNTLGMHIALLKAGYSVMIFPEGTRTQTGTLLPAKMGVAILAEKSKCEVIPMAISGTFGLSFADFWSGEKRVLVSFGAPMALHRQKTSDAITSYFSKKRVYIRKARAVMQKIGEMLSALPAEDADTEDT